MQLVLPERKYYPSYLSAIEEYRAFGVTSYAFLNPAVCDVFERIENFRTGTNLRPGYVRATYLWLVEDGEFLGEVSIRHSLTDALVRYGGNIGYGVRRSRWGQGVGTAMLSMALPFARDALKLDRVLITCDDDNLASARVIEKNGGMLQDKVENAFEDRTVLTRRYWIELT